MVISLWKCVLFVCLTVLSRWGFCATCRNSSIGLDMAKYYPNPSSPYPPPAPAYPRPYSLPPVPQPYPYPPQTGPYPPSQSLPPPTHSFPPIQNLPPQLTPNNSPSPNPYEAQAPQSGPDFSVLFITAPDSDFGKKLALDLVKKKLASVVNVVPHLHSVYSWKGKICEDREALMMIRTKTSEVGKIDAYVRAKHPFEIFEVVSLPIQDGNPEYLKWMGDALEIKKSD